jgi:hypothetical protein
MPKWDELACPKCGEAPNGLNVDLAEKHYSSLLPHGSWRGYKFNCFNCQHVVTIKIETRPEREEEKNV